MKARALVLALGKFDSLHMGHRALLARAADLGRPGIVRFRGMAETLGWQRRMPLLDERQLMTVLGRWSAELRSQVAVVSMAFDRLRALQPEDFMAVLRREYRVGGVVVGEDFRFGRDRRGDADLLRDRGPLHGLQVAVEASVRQGGAVVSTTRIREAVAKGDLGLATAMLGRPYRLTGTVVPGDGRGRRLGFPTANCAAVPNLLPATGVYAAWARLEEQGRWLPAAVNIGHLPTFRKDGEAAVEAHLIDWQGDCYARVIELDLIERLRPEERFDNVKALKAQIAADVDATRRLLADHPQTGTVHNTRRITA